MQGECGTAVTQAGNLGTEVGNGQRGWPFSCGNSCSVGASLKEEQQVDPFRAGQGQITGERYRPAGKFL